MTSSGEVLQRFSNDLLHWASVYTGTVPCCQWRRPFRKKRAFCHKQELSGSSSTLALCRRRSSRATKPRRTKARGREVVRAFCHLKQKRPCGGSMGGPSMQTLQIRQRRSQTRGRQPVLFTVLNTPGVSCPREAVLPPPTCRCQYNLTTRKWRLIRSRAVQSHFREIWKGWCGSILVRNALPAARGRPGNLHNNWVTSRTHCKLLVDYMPHVSFAKSLARSKPGSGKPKRVRL